MVIFLNEDRAYLSWLSHHRQGFVIDWMRQPTRKKPVLHRASCPAVRAPRTKRTRLTTARHLKACSLDREELLNWAEDESGHRPVVCDECTATEDSGAKDAAKARPLTRLEREVLDYVVDTAVIHMDQMDAGYRLAVEDVAQYLDKTAAQISPAVQQLAQAGYLQLDGVSDPTDNLPLQQPILPTASALRMLPAFQQASDRKIQADLDSLRRGLD